MKYDRTGMDKQVTDLSWFTEVAGWQVTGLSWPTLKKATGHGFGVRVSNPVKF